MIEVAGVTKRYGRKLAVDDLGFRAEPGRVTGFLGPNGAGKTTTLRAILGLTRPDRGETRVLGSPYSKLEHPGRRVGAVLESSGFHPGRSGRTHLRILATGAGLPRRRVDEVLELVELTPDARRRVKGYSLGMRQRLAVAGALLGEPEVLVLDEPGNGLDPRGIRWLRDLLRGLAAEGRTVLVSSHVLAEVAQTVDEVVVIHKGRLVVQSTVEELVARAGGGARVRSPDAARLLELLAAAGIEATDNGEAILAAAAPERVGQLAAEHAVVLHELGDDAPTLEDAFLKLTGEEGV